MKEQIINEITNNFPHMHGWCSIEKACKIVEIIWDNKLKNCLEIGVFGGKSLLAQALTLKYMGDGKAFGIDPWNIDDALEEMKDEAHRNWWAAINMNDIFESCQHHLRLLGCAGFFDLIKDKAENVVNIFNDNFLDFLHIDGNHSEMLSYKDATLYLPKVKSGGYIFFDDIYWSEGNGVTTRKAIGFLLESCERVDIVEDCLILKKF